MPSASSSNSTSTTPFITFIPAGVAPICYPPNALDPDLDAAQERTSLDPNYPAFQDAMTVREEVFVKEQGVPLENELDEDDHRSFHWVVYASVASSCTPPHRQHHHHHPGSGGGGSSTTRIPVGTIRLIPPPAAPHMQIPYYQSHQQHHPDSPPPPDIPDASSSSSSAAAAAGGACGEKNYIKLGRLATIPAFRGLGIGKLLVETALTWAAEHPEEIMGDIKSNKRLSVGNLSIMEQVKKASATATSVSIASSGVNRGSPSAGSSGNGGGIGQGQGGVEKRDRDLSAVIAGAARGGDLRSPAAGLLLLQAGKGWEGKVLVHAQKDVKKMWEKFGFVYDPGMGEWVEEGIVHVGLWKQLQLKKPS